MAVSSATSRYFRFLDLPPELRISVYVELFKCDSTVEIEALQAKSQAPSSAIALVSRALHAESVGYLQAALRHYWDTHRFCFDFDLGIKSKYQLDTEKWSDSVVEPAKAACLPPMKKVRIYLRHRSIDAQVENVWIIDVESKPDERWFSLKCELEGTVPGVRGALGAHFGTQSHLSYWARFLSTGDSNLAPLSTQDTARLSALKCMVFAKLLYHSTMVFTIL